MAKRSLPRVDDEPLPHRIAAGLQKLGQAMKHQAWQHANDEGLSATQGQILAMLVTSGPLTGTELSERLGVTLPTISDSARVLVEKELVTKSPDPRHPRASLITPTARGRTLGARARSWVEFLADAAATLPANEQAAFYAGVLKMIASLQDQGLIPVEKMCVTCKYFRPHVRTGAKPHHCALVDAPLGNGELRLDCPDHERGTK